MHVTLKAYKCTCINKYNMQGYIMYNVWLSGLTLCICDQKVAGLSLVMAHLQVLEQGPYFPAPCLSWTAYSHL